MSAPRPDRGVLRDRLVALPRAERDAALTAAVVAELKVSLLMTSQDELALDANYFELGLTSLRVVDVKCRLEDLLACEIDTSALFNRPTVAQLLTHLTDDILTDLFAGPAGPESPAPTEPSASPDPRRAAVDDLLRRLYQS